MKALLIIAFLLLNQQMIYTQQITMAMNMSAVLPTETTSITSRNNSVVPTPTLNLDSGSSGSSNSSNNTTLFPSPSPTSFVYTHFPMYPMHTMAGSSSSAMSSARPSQSAPFPDDTIGKYGRLHISNAMIPSSPCLFLVLISSYCTLVMIGL